MRRWRVGWKSPSGSSRLRPRDGPVSCALSGRYASRSDDPRQARSWKWWRPHDIRSPTGEPMDAKVREEIETAVHALDEALGGLINFTMTLRPTLRNEIMQICGHHIEKARQARDRLEALLQDSGS